MYHAWPILERSWISLHLSFRIISDKHNLANQYRWKHSLRRLAEALKSHPLSKKYINDSTLRRNNFFYELK